MTATQTQHLCPDAQVVMTAAEIRSDRTAWLEARKLGIGGSDIAALMGDGKYEDSTEYDVWLDKTGRRFALESNEAMEAGNHFEGYVADWFATRNDLQVVTAGLLRSATHPHALASADRLVNDGGGLEIKYQEWFMSRDWKDGSYPRAFYWQCVQGLAVTGRSHWWLASLLGARHLEVRRIDRADVMGDIELVLERCEAWWEGHVAPDIPPDKGAPVDFEELIQDSVEASMPELVLDDTQRWREILLAEKAMELEKKEIQARMMLELGSHKSLAISGVPIVRLVERKGSARFDRAGLKSVNPELEAQFTKVGAPTRFPQLIQGSAA